MILKRKAFTLIELLVVVAIIGLLSTIAVVGYGSSREKARLAAGRSFEQSIHNAAGDQIVGQWDFEDCTGTGIAATSAFDFSGSGNDGTIVGSPQWSSDTQAGNGCSLYLDGSDDYVDLGNITSAEISQQVTLSAWVKNEANSQGGIISKGLVNGAELSLTFGYSNPTLLVARAHNSSSTQISYPWTGALLSGWHHLAMTVGSGGMKLYIDGKMVAQNGNTIIDSNTEPFQIGYHGTNFHLRSYIDDARIYASSISSANIQKYYAESRPAHPLAVSKKSGR